MQTLTWPSPTPTPDFPSCLGELLCVVSELPDASTLSCPSLPKTWLSSATSWVESACALSPHGFQAWNGDRSAVCPIALPSALSSSLKAPHSLEGLASTLYPCHHSPVPTSWSPSVLRWAYQSLAPYFSILSPVTIFGDLNIPIDNSDDTTASEHQPTSFLMLLSSTCKCLLMM